MDFLFSEIIQFEGLYIKEVERERKKDKMSIF